MQNIRPKAITINHFRRRVVVYIRCAVYSSTSVDQQVSQKDFALRWGWPVDAIEVISDEVTSSGLDANRIGYQRLLRMIQDGQVGLVLVINLSRLSRSSLEVQHFLDLCRSTDTLLAANGAILPRDEHEQLLDQLRKCLAEFEHQRRIRRHPGRRRQAMNKTSKRIKRKASEEV